MHIHVLGIGGTFMAGMARLAVELGHKVTGSDQALYPPMSTQLESLGIEISDGYSANAFAPRPDLTVIGNALSRGNAAVEYVLDHALPFISGPEWLERNVLAGRHVIAIAGTHGKTTVASLVAWMLDYAGLKPGFLIGGVVENFGVSARLGDAPYFVIEADEYDTAFFDKRSKFIHYHPRTLVINNLEFDHADIFADLAAIQREFHHLIRTLPSRGRILYPAGISEIDGVLARGCWSQTSTFGQTELSDWRFDWRDGAKRSLGLTAPDGSKSAGPTPLLGLHNAWNVTAAVSAAADVGVEPQIALDAVAHFANIRRRLEMRGESRGIRVYDDFAHHPTAIAATISALRGSIAGGRIIALLEPRSNTMIMGIHEKTLGPSLVQADAAAILVPDGLPWDIREALALYPHIEFFADVDELVSSVVRQAQAGDHILAMSNGAFAGIHAKILSRLREL